MPKTILISNDDGYDAEGIRILYESLGDLGDVWVSAPADEQSASSHSLSIRSKIRAEKVRHQHYKVWGTPTDSVLLGVIRFLGRKPDLIVSGINHGPNMGEDVTYSGTVAAAIEGNILGVPSIAFSALQRQIKSPEELGHVARSLVEDGMKLGLPAGCLLNVNIPDPTVAPIKGVRITKLGSRHYENLLSEEKDSDGSFYYTIGGEEPVWKDHDGSDISAVREGYVSVTPLHLDLTDYKAIVEMERWRFDL